MRFDLPIARCELVREMVLRDQMQSKCAREHKCPPKRIRFLLCHLAEKSGFVE